MSSSIDLRGKPKGETNFGQIHIEFDQQTKKAKATFKADGGTSSKQLDVTDLSGEFQFSHKEIEHQPCCFDAETADGPQSIPVEVVKVETVSSKLAIDAEAQTVTLSANSPERSSSALVALVQKLAPKGAIVTPDIRDSYHAYGSYEQDFNGDEALDKASMSVNITEGGSSSSAKLVLVAK